MKGSLVLFMALLALVAHSCKEQPPSAPTPEPQRTLTLSVADTSLHEIWLRVVLPDSLSGRTVKIYRNDTLRFAFELVRRDTVLMDSGLAFGTRYTYRAVRSSDTRALDSTQLSTATMPTTSHAVVWRVDTLGTTATWLNDVCVVNDTCIWVVGQINGSSYNAARFDGHQWHFYSFSLPQYNGDGTLAGFVAGEFQSVIGFSPSSVLFTDGGGISKWNGISLTHYPQLMTIQTGEIKKIWASSENDIYVVGGNGFIAHYNGTAWRRVQSGTTTLINDIWGSIDKAMGDTLVLCRAIFNTAPAGRLLRLNKHHAPTFFTEYPSGFYSLWFRNQAHLFGSGLNVYWRRHGEWQTFTGLATPLKLAIRASAENNLFCVGNSGLVLHFNGENWHQYLHASGQYWLTSVSVKENVVCAAGFVGGFGSVGIVLIGLQPMTK